MITRRVLPFFLLLFAGMSSGLLNSQTFRGGIAGSISDSSGAAIPGASIRAVNEATGLTRTTTTGTGGDFNVQDLPLGVYTVTISQTGFESVRSKVTVEVGKMSDLVLKLNVATQATTLEVDASAVLIETTSTAINNVIPTKAVQEIPLNGRDFTQLVKLAPGANASGSVNGARPSQNNWQIDGADNNDQWHNSAAVNQGGVSGVAGTLLPIEAIDQFSVQSNGSSEAGRNGGASINLVIKSGTNALHGSVYYFNRNDALAAQNPFAPAGSPTPKLKNNQYGFSLGGPVWKNHTFYFVTYEGQRFIAGNTLSDTIPSVAYVNQAKAVLSQYGVAVNPVSVNLLSLWPDRSRQGPATSPNFFGSDNNNYNSDNGIIKLDHIFNERNNIAFRYFGGTGSQTAYVGSTLKEYYQVAPSRMHNFSLVYNRVFSPHLVSQTLAGVNYFKQTFNDFSNSFNPVALGLNTGVTNPTLAGAPDVLINGFSETGLTPPLGRIDTTGHLTETMTYTTGRHQIRFGGEFRRARFDVFYQRNKRGSFAFDGSAGPWAKDATIDPSIRALADFMAGDVAAGNASITRGDLQRNYDLNAFNWFVHDNFQVTPKLNLNFGVNYTYQGPISDPTNRISTFIPSKGGIVFTGKGGIDSLHPADWNNFAPRFGFAYTPKPGGKFVVRGGYGIFYDVPAINLFADNRPPNRGASGILSNPAGSDPVYALSNRTPFTIVAGQTIFGDADIPSPPYGAFSVSQHWTTPYLQNYNLNGQYQLSNNTFVQIGYVGSLGRHQLTTIDINQPLPGTGSIQSRRPYNAAFPTLGAINEIQTVGNSAYNSLQTSLRSTSWHGITSQFAYTFSHSQDDLSSVRGRNPMNSNDLRADYGNSDFDTPHSFVGFVSYSLPSPSSYKRLFGGWQLNSLLSFYSGTPFTVVAGKDNSNTGERRDRVDVISDPFSNVPKAASNTFVYYYNPAAFALPAPGSYGTEKRNQFYGPGVKQVDFSVFKNTPITERISTQLRLEMFNLFNAKILSPPSTTFTSSSNGKVFSTLGAYNGAPGIGTGEPFNVQLALKVIF